MQQAEEVAGGVFKDLCGTGAAYYLTSNDLGKKQKEGREVGDNICYDAQPEGFNEYREGLEFHTGST